MFLHALSALGRDGALVVLSAAALSPRAEAPRLAGRRQVRRRVSECRALRCVRERSQATQELLAALCDQLEPPPSADVFVAPLASFDRLLTTTTTTSSRAQLDDCLLALKRNDSSRARRAAAAAPAQVWLAGDADVDGARASSRRVGSRRSRRRWRRRGATTASATATPLTRKRRWRPTLVVQRRLSCARAANCCRNSRRTCD